MPLPADKKPVVLSPNAFRRLRRVVDKVDRSPWSGDPRNGPATPINPGVMRARVTTAIPSGTWSAPSSSGAVQIYHKEFDSGEWVATGDPVPCLNDQDAGSSGVAVDTTCKVAWISGDIWLIQADCNATPEGGA